MASTIGTGTNIISGTREAINISRETTNTVGAGKDTVKVAVALVDESKMESANKLLASTKYFTAAGAVANGLAAGVNGYNAYTAYQQGETTKAATTSIVAAGNAVDAARGVLTFMGKQVNPALKAAGVAGDFASAYNTYHNPDSTTAHQIAATVAALAGTVSLAASVATYIPGAGTVIGPIVGSIAGAVEGAANVVSANESRKELAATERAATEPAANPG